MRKHWVIPDIHGCAKTLKALIEDMVMPTKHDWVYFLGDYIDRGPASKEVIEYLMHLQKEEYNVRFLMGNHEDYLLKAYDEELKGKSFLGFKQKGKKKKEWLFHGGKQCMESYGISNLKDMPKEHIDWMRKLEYYIELDDYLLVHAGFNFNNPDPFEDKDAMLWVRDYEIDKSRIKNKKIIHGHVPVNLEFIYMNLRNNFMKFIDLDNGVYMNKREGFGNLVALELITRDYKAQYNLDL
ncbi:MAG: hypothetical protein DRJ05_04185 [Bacteroidetes bacterium]|nr:MAG: hypothetical protein DRJ05_04185 [Bacteroidota bacterium]